VSFLDQALETLRFFADSYLATIAIALVVTYLGVFVVLKRIVFLGITLAQAAAAGIALVFFVQGYLPGGGWLDEVLESYGPTVSALAVSTLGVAAFALPGDPKRLSRETLLGLGYVLFSGASIVLVWWSPKGTEELKNLLAGDVLFAREHLKLLLTGLGLVALLHASLRKEFLVVSYDPDFASAGRLPVRLYDVLLALSLGVAVSLALKVAGILLVFAFLAVPPAAGLLVGKRLSHATLIALGVALASSVLGWSVARREDLPVSPTIACFLVAHAAVAAAVAKAHRRPLTWLFLGEVAFFAAVALGAALHVLGRPDGKETASHVESVVASPPPTGDELVAAFRTATTTETQKALAEQLAASSDQRIVDEFVKAVLTREEEGRELALAIVAEKGDRTRSIKALEPLLRATKADLRLHAAMALVRFEDARGLEAVVQTLGDAESKPGTREEAHAFLVKLNPGGEAFGYDAFGTRESNRAAIAAWEKWRSVARPPRAP